MKTQLLIGSALLAAVSAFSQAAFTRPKPSGMVNARSIMEYKYSAREGIPTSTKPSAVISHPAKKASATEDNTWQNFTSSMNIYGVSNSYVKPLQWNDELNTVTFIHRKSPTYMSSPAASADGENGTIVTMVTKDCGITWDSTLMWVNSTFWARFPGGAVYNPPGNTDINNAYMVGSGPVTGAGNVVWTGNWYSSKKLGTYDNTLSSVANATQLAVSAGSPLPNVSRHDFSAYGFTATDDGKVRVLAGITDDGLNPVSDTAIMLVTGTYTNGVFDWAGQPLWMPVTKNCSDGSYNFVSRPMMAWNEAGTTGYVVVMGSRLGATGSNVGYQPIVYKTINSGQTWSLEGTYIDFNSPAFADVKRSLQAISTDPLLEVPNFFWGEGMDCAVDADNKLHIFTSIIGHPSNDPDSLNFVSQFTSEKYLWPHQPGFRPYLYDFIYDGTNNTPSWSHILVDSMSSESVNAGFGAPGYEYNPWDKDPSKANDKFGIDARLQMSRTPDGKYLLYTWAESDTAFTDNQTQWNAMPNIKARLMDLPSNHLLHYEIDVTTNASGDISGRAMCHFISPKFKLISKTDERIIINIPMTVSNSSPYTQLSPNTHWYSCANLEFLRPMSADPENYVGIAENKSTTSSSSVYPNPAKNNVAVNVELAHAGNIHIDLINAMGQVIKTSQAQGQTGPTTINIDLAGLPTGLYFVKIKTGTTISTKKLIIE